MHTTGNFGSGDGSAEAFIVKIEEDSQKLQTNPHQYGFALYKDGDFIKCYDRDGISCNSEIDNDHYTIRGTIRKAGDRFYIDVIHMVKTNDLY